MTDILNMTFPGVPTYHAEDLFARAQAFRQAGGVARFHTEPMLPPQPVSSHSWNGTILCRLFWPEEPELLWLFLIHDTPELGTGDPPAPLKWNRPALKKEFKEAEAETRAQLGICEDADLPTPRQEAQLKIVDYLELLWTCVEEMSRGNSYAAPIFRRVSKRMEALFRDPYLSGVNLEQPTYFWGQIVGLGGKLARKVEC